MGVHCRIRFVFGIIPPRSCIVSFVTCANGVGVSVAVDHPFDLSVIRSEFEHLEHIVDSSL